VKRTFELTIPAAMEFLILVRRTIRDLGFLFSFPELELEKVVLAVDEACTNSIRNLRNSGDGEGNIRIMMELSTECCAVTVCDEGDEFHGEFERRVNLGERIRSMETSGYGIPIIKQIMDHVQYEHLPGKGNRLCMTKFHTSHKGAGHSRD
jgi:serine/threonine-protein kinase RsbW